MALRNEYLNAQVVLLQPDGNKLTVLLTFYVYGKVSNFSFVQ